MGDVVNLRRARKRRGRVAAEKAAERNRAAHGRTKAERDAASADRDAAARVLDAHYLDEDDR